MYSTENDEPMITSVKSDSLNFVTDISLDIMITSTKWPDKIIHSQFEVLS